MAQKSIAEKIKEVGKHGIIYGFGSIAQSAAGFLLLPLYAKYLVPHAFGVFSLIQLIGTISGAIFYLGASSALPRSYFDYDDPEDRKRVFNTTLLLLFSGAAIQIIIAALFSNFFSSIIIGSSDYGKLVFINLVSSAILFINTGFFIYLRILRKSTIVVIMSIMSFLVTVSIAYYLLISENMGISAPIYAIFGSQILILLFFLFYLRDSISLFPIFRKEIRIQLKFGIPSVLASVSLMISDWGDRIILGQILSISDVGIYSMGVRIAMLYNIVIVLPFAMIWSPMMMEYKNDENIKELFTRVTFYYSVISVVCIVLCFLFMDDILGLFDMAQNYAVSIKLIPFIMAGLYLSSLQNIFSAGVFYKRKPILLVYVYLAIGGINILLNLLLVPILGLWGAVTSGILSRLALAVAVYVVSGRYFQFKLDYIRYLKLTTLVLAILLMEYQNSVHHHGGIIIDICLFSLFIVCAIVIILNGEERAIITKIIKSFRN
jgi:O-antigen/teichoic acid export membrane protein